MSKTDWKGLLNTQLGNLPEGPHEPAKEKSSANFSSHRQDLTIRFEKRNGKPATIVSHFQGTDAELKGLAGNLKKFCGVGGSAKDDEILIQGDVRNKVVEYLKKQGHAVKGDYEK
jgi:translation initiation factor 1